MIPVPICQKMTFDNKHILDRTMAPLIASDLTPTPKSERKMNIMLEGQVKDGSITTSKNQGQDEEAFLVPVDKMTVSGRSHWVEIGFQWEDQQARQHHQPQQEQQHGYDEIVALTGNEDLMKQEQPQEEHPCSSDDDYSVDLNKGIVKNPPDDAADASSAAAAAASRLAKLLSTLDDYENQMSLDLATKLRIGEAIGELRRRVPPPPPQLPGTPKTPKTPKSSSSTTRSKKSNKSSPSNDDEGNNRERSKSKTPVVKNKKSSSSSSTKEQVDDESKPTDSKRKTSRSPHAIGKKGRENNEKPTIKSSKSRSRSSNDLMEQGSDEEKSKKKKSRSKSEHDDDDGNRKSRRSSEKKKQKEGTSSSDKSSTRRSRSKSRHADAAVAAEQQEQEPRTPSSRGKRSTRRSSKDTLSQKSPRSTPDDHAKSPSQYASHPGLAELCGGTPSTTGDETISITVSRHTRNRSKGTVTRRSRSPSELVESSPGMVKSSSCHARLSRPSPPRIAGKSSGSRTRSRSVRKSRSSGELSSPKKHGVALGKESEHSNLKSARYQRKMEGANKTERGRRSIIDVDDEDHSYPLSQRKTRSLSPKYGLYKIDRSESPSTPVRSNSLRNLLVDNVKPPSMSLLDRHSYHASDSRCSLSATPMALPYQVENSDSIPQQDAPKTPRRPWNILSLGKHSNHPEEKPSINVVTPGTTPARKVRSLNEFIEAGGNGIRSSVTGGGMKKSTSFGTRSLFGQHSNHRNNDDEQSIRSAKSAATLGNIMLRGSRNCTSTSSNSGPSLRQSLMGDLGLVLSRSNHKRDGLLGHSSNHSRMSAGGLGGKLSSLVTGNKVTPVALDDDGDDDISSLIHNEKEGRYQTETILSSTETIHNRNSPNPTILLPTRRSSTDLQRQDGSAIRPILRISSKAQLGSNNSLHQLTKRSSHESLTSAMKNDAWELSSSSKQQNATFTFNEGFKSHSGSKGGGNMSRSKPSSLGNLVSAMKNDDWGQQSSQHKQNVAFSKYNSDDDSFRKNNDALLKLSQRSLLGNRSAHGTRKSSSFGDLMSASSKNDDWSKSSSSSNNKQQQQQNATFINKAGIQKAIDASRNPERRREEIRNALLSCLDDEQDKDFLNFLKGAPPKPRLDLTGRFSSQ